MKQSDFPSFNEINEVLLSTADELHASQVHGLICGLLCGNPHIVPSWKEMLAAEDANMENTEAVLQQLYQASSQQLKEFLFELELVLPADSEPLPLRAEALTLWVQGFLTGLKMTKVPLENLEPSDMTDAINDMIEIAKMNYEEVVATEEDEAAFVELEEYVRIGVILIYQELRDSEMPASEDTSDRSLH